MNFPERASAAALAVSLFALCPGAAQALGLGRPSTRAVLGEPLRLSVPLRLEPGEQLADECVSADVYFGDDKLSRTAVSALVLPAPASAPLATSAPTRTLLVRTQTLVNEPVVTVYLSAGCQARITRKFVALADPPTPVVGAPAVPAPDVAADEAGSGAAGGASAAAAAAAQEGGLAAQGGGSRAANPAGAAAGPHRAASAMAPRPERRKPARATSAPGAQAVALAPPGGHSRLQLDPVEADALVSPQLRATVAMSAQQAASAQAEGPEVQARRDAAAALWRALNTTPEQQLRDQQRLLALEKRLAQLHSEGEQTRQSVSLLQARMREIDTGRPGTWWLYGLAALALAATGAAVYFHGLWRRQERERSAWWPPHSGAAPLSVPSEAVPDTASPPETEAPSASRHGSQSAAGGLASSAASSMAAASIPAASMAAPTSLTASVGEGAAEQAFASEPLRAVSIEELIDLEQQAEFFVVLGQDDAAISLLEAHVEGTDGTIPLPFLKLLELYQRLGRRDDHERVQAAFNAHFNGHAPAWEADLQQGRSLTDYPGVIERLQALWPQPSRAMDVLEHVLIRPDAQAETFDLPAYRELLFLCAIARDLADKPVTGFDALVTPVTPLTPLMATRPVIADPQARPMLDVDLCLDDIGEPPAQGSGAAGARATAGLPTPPAGASARGDAPTTEPGSDYRP